MKAFYLEHNEVDTDDGGYPNYDDNDGTIIVQQGDVVYYFVMDER